MSEFLTRPPRDEEIIELTRFLVHKHYCENDIEAVVAQFDEDFVWIGAGEDEYDCGGAHVASIFRNFSHKLPACHISEEEYRVQTIAPGAYLCSGRMWIATDAATLISLRVHQRISALFRLADGRLRCCHVHISNPYDDMHGDVGFPVKMAQQSYQYLQEQLEIQKQHIAAQTALLEKLSYEDSLTGLYNRNKFNAVMDMCPCADGLLGVACFDLNGLKEQNDLYGHRSGDELLRQAAHQLLRVFRGMAYRIGGDEFVVLDNRHDEAAFRQAVAAVHSAMEENGISCAVGLSWRGENCHPQEQFDEADRAMYFAKRRHYGQTESGVRD